MKHYRSFFFLRRPAMVPVVRLQGAIGMMGPRSLSDQSVAPLLERAFNKGKPTAVALVINSPGGSPVQSSLIASCIRRLADEKGIPVHAFVEDVAASGGYWLATAADDIWVDASSIVGSIGVIRAGFGLHEFISRYGIERRVHTAGRSKSFMDPFKPESDEDAGRINALLTPLHENFIAQVKERRAGRLDVDADVFNADIWLGQKAVDLGLADGVGHVVPKLKELYGDKVRIEPHSPKRGFLQKFGVGLMGDLTGAALYSVEERSLWAHYNL